MTLGRVPEERRSGQLGTPIPSAILTKNSKQAPGLRVPLVREGGCQRKTSAPQDCLRCGNAAADAAMHTLSDRPGGTTYGRKKQSAGSEICNAGKLMRK
jgi:hypothetical protein